MTLLITWLLSDFILTIYNLIVLVDSPDLIGAFCVWLTAPKGSERRRQALNGRFLSCKWDVSELEMKFDDILTNDLLRFRIAVD